MTASAQQTGIAAQEPLKFKDRPALITSNPWKIAAGMESMTACHYDRSFSILSETGESEMPTEQEKSGRVRVHLLDTALGHAVQTWKFDDCVRISIGRSEDTDVSLADKQVSRLHVELIFSDGRWLLRSLGRNGTQVDGKMVSEAFLDDQAVFQLGPSGPKFRIDSVEDSGRFTATIANFGHDELEHLFIDQDRKTEEVRKIAESEAFRELQEQARQLRQQKPE